MQWERIKEIFFELTMVRLHSILLSQYEVMEGNLFFLPTKMN